MIWKTLVKFVDIETGEFISKWEAKDNYITIKKIKDVKLNKEAFRGTITIYYISRRKERTQGNLF